LYKAAVYTNVNGDIVSYTSKTAKIKKVILPSNTSPNVNVMLSNITFFDAGDPIVGFLDPNLPIHYTTAIKIKCSLLMRIPITGSAVALHCCKAHAKINRKMGNSTPCKIVTPENIILKLCTRDYVGEMTHHASVSNRNSVKMCTKTANVIVKNFLF